MGQIALVSGLPDAREVAYALGGEIGRGGTSGIPAALYVVRRVVPFLGEARRMNGELAHRARWPP
jgi:hypothetical protein